MTGRPPENLPCWSYHGDEGPDQWGHLHPDWAACANGREQSPVILHGSEPVSSGDRLAFDYRATLGKMSARAHTVQVDMSPGCQLVLRDRAFSLRQFHFHTPSEHWWSEAADVGEIHLVHATDSGEVAVLGVALRPDGTQTIPKSLWSWFRTAEAGEERTLDPTGLVPGRGGFLGYEGSLTTPPCTEGVRWLLAMEPVAVGPEERSWLERRMGRNARPARPLDGRVVREVLREGS